MKSQPFVHTWAHKCAQRPPPPSTHWELLQPSRGQAPAEKWFQVLDTSQEPLPNLVGNFKWLNLAQVVPAAWLHVPNRCMMSIGQQFTPLLTIICCLRVGGDDTHGTSTLNKKQYHVPFKTIHVQVTQSPRSPLASKAICLHTETCRKMKCIFFPKSERSLQKKKTTGDTCAPTQTNRSWRQL